MYRLTLSDMIKSFQHKGLRGFLKPVRLAGYGQTTQSVCLECCSSWIAHRYLATSTFRDGACIRSEVI